MDVIEFIDIAQQLDDVTHCIADWAIDLEGTDAGEHMAVAVDSVTAARASLCGYYGKLQLWHCDNSHFSHYARGMGCEQKA